MDLNRSLKSTLMTLADYRYRYICGIEGVEYCPTEYKKDNTPPAEGWMPYNPDIPLKGCDAHFWLRTSFTTPRVGEDEQLVLRTVTGKEGDWDATNPQGIVYLNGEMVQGLDTNHTEILLESEKHYDLFNYFYVGMINDPVSCRMSLYALHTPTNRLYYDYKVPYDVCCLLPDNSEHKAKISSLLWDVGRILDLRQRGSEGYNRSVEEAIDYLDRELYRGLCSTEGKPVVHCIGHTHIDVEWQWTRAQTREKIQRSFATAKRLMDQYPEYKFTLSQPELYRYLKEEAPTKYEELRTLVKEGRWEPEGAMYLEADCNLTSGESLVRQILKGKQFFKEEFGVDSRVLFLPDVFGYSAAMPQILKKSGVDFFVTSKISWNDTNTMPKDAFYWQGIDGSEIFTTFITAQSYNGGRMTNGTTYVGRLTPDEVLGARNRFQQKEYTNRAITTYGFGDGGGGPTAEMLEVQRRLAKGIPGMPVTKTDFLVNYLEVLKSEFDSAAKRTGRVPKWVGELYLEFHRGTYTSVAKVKKGNRSSELLLACAEALSATHGIDTPHDTLNYLWRKVLHNQFHDILPGSSIGSVYDGTDKDYAMIKGEGERIIEDKLCAIASSVGSDGGTLVYNPTGFDRPLAMATSEGYIETDDIVPALGWKVVNVKKTPSRVKINGLTAENDYYVLTLNESGAIRRLYDKTAGREVFLEGSLGNLLTVLDDHPTVYDAWELEDHARYKARTLDVPVTITPVEDGSRAGFRIELDYMHSHITQTLWLYSRIARIDFDNEIDWNDPHQILKASFPFDVHCTAATYDVQYGHVTRPTHENTSWDEAKFEVYAHKWVDVAEHGYGVALLNDCKYGYSILGSTLSLTMLKCATYPSSADICHHSFTYSLLPHSGDFREAGVIEESWALVQPLRFTEARKQEGILPEECSFTGVNKQNMIITALKPAEDGDGVVLRMHEGHDKRTACKVTMPAGFTRVYLTDLLENELEELSVSDGNVAIEAKPFEIITLKFKK